MTINTLILIFISVSFSVSAQILLKYGMSSTAVQMVMGSEPSKVIFVILGNMSVLSGLFAYVVSAAIWLFVLSKIDVSKAYPFVGLGFISTMIFASIFLNKPLNSGKVAGTILVAIGVILISH